MSHRALAEASAAPNRSTSPGGQEMVAWGMGRLAEGSFGSGTRLLNPNNPGACFHWTVNRMSV